jgi:hypothetical protein
MDLSTSHASTRQLTAEPVIATGPRPAVKYAVEAIGTFFLVFTVGAAVGSRSPLAPLGIGAVLMVMIYRQDQQDQVCGCHTRSKPLISPNMAATNPITPITTQTSAMPSTLAPQPVTARWRRAPPRWRNGERPIAMAQPTESSLHTKVLSGREAGGRTRSDSFCSRHVVNGHRAIFFNSRVDMTARCAFGVMRGHDRRAASRRNR